MGLDVSHDCFEGAYSAFNSLRMEWARALQLPPLHLMEGYYEKGQIGCDPFLFATQGAVLSSVSCSEYDVLKWKVLDFLPIKWRSLKPNPVYKLLYHSDCDGKLLAKDCLGIAKSLEKIWPKLKDGGNGGHIWDYKEVTQKWINGLKLEAENNEDVEFC